MMLNRTLSALMQETYSEMTSAIRHIFHTNTSRNFIWYIKVSSHCLSSLVVCLGPFRCWLCVRARQHSMCLEVLLSSKPLPIAFMFS